MIFKNLRKAKYLLNKILKILEYNFKTIKIKFKRLDQVKRNHLLEDKIRFIENSKNNFFVN